MQRLIVSECPRSGREFDAVLALLKRAKGTVGFLPDAAVRDRAERGTLLVAADGTNVLGYALFDLPRDVIRLVQLVVDPSARRRGIARRLIEEVATRNGSRRGIMIHCRRDFDASQVWPRLGFVPLDERAGRGADGKALTMWWRDFGHPTLITHIAAMDERPLAAIDVNVVIDLAERLPTPSVHLTADWMAAACRLGVTDEVYIEVERHDNDDVRRRHKRFAKQLEQITAPRSVWEALEAAVVERIGARAPAFSTDIRHSAKAAAGGARWLVTRDERFRRACARAVSTVCGVTVVSPTGFVREVDRLARGDIYRPVDLVGSEIAIRPLLAEDIDRAARAFVNQREGERFRDFRSLLNEQAAETRHTTAVVFEAESELLAVVIVRHGRFDDIAVCRAGHDRRGQTIARHVLGWVRSLPGDSRAAVLSDAHCGASVLQAAAEEGFWDSQRGRTALTVNGAGTVAHLDRDVRRLIEALPSEAVPIRARLIDFLEAGVGAPLALEKAFPPYWITAAGIKTFVVPIKHAWAAELIDPSLARSQLFSRSTSLALQREHVYYRSPRASAGLSASSRILWYVSGPGHGGRAIRATSHLDEVVVGDAARLFRRFAHLGVYSESQVLHSAVAGRVMALRFSNTRTLSQPVGLEQYRQLVGQEHPGKGVTVAGPQPVSERVFASIASLPA